MSEVNIPLLRKAVEWVEQQDKLPKDTRQWLQTIYVAPEEERLSIFQHEAGCGTAYCVAGYIGMLVNPGFSESQWVGDEHVSSIATKALGLTHGQAVLLFSATNTAERVRMLAEQFAGEKL